MYRIFVSDDMGMLDGLTAALRDRTAQAVEITAEAIENADRLADRVAETEPDALVAGGLTPVDAGVLSATELDLVARGGVGYDNVDVETARERGVTVTNAPDYCREEVATHAVSLLAAATRRLGRYDRQTRSGGWDWAEAPAPMRLSETTLGCVGFGSIAREAATVADGLVGETLVYDPYVDRETAATYGAELVDFETLTREAELLAVFAPLTPETRELVDAAALDRLPEGATVVNVGRGAVVDDEAVVAALADGPVAAAGLDVLPTEPPVDSPLVGREDVLVTPHAGWYSTAAQADLVATVAEAVGAVAGGERPAERVTVVGAD